MRYGEIRRAVFLERPNRFVARVRLEDGGETVVHVKNTGRCRELLLPGVPVILAKGENPGRRTAWDLVGVYKRGALFNIDSQAPNRAAAEWLAAGGYDGIRFDAVKPEYRIGASRIDFCMEHAGERYLMEVKGCTLERDGIGYFPDAPTERGTKHLRELTEAVRLGYRCAAAFVIQTEGVTEVLPNRETDPAFGEALDRARDAGVRVLFLPCRVWESGIEALVPGTTDE